MGYQLTTYSYIDMTVCACLLSGPPHRSLHHLLPELESCNNALFCTYKTDEFSKTHHVDLTVDLTYIS